MIVSPDAGGAKRASAIADGLGMPFALIHKVRRFDASAWTGSDLGLQERRPTKITDRQNSTMMLVGDVANRTCIVIDDLVDTSNTITRAAKLLKKDGAKLVYALITHGVLSGDAIEKINASHLDKVVVTNSVPQEEHKKRCPKLVVLDVGHLFAEVRGFVGSVNNANSGRRSGESITERASACYSNMIERREFKLQHFQLGYTKAKSSVLKEAGDLIY